MTEETAKTVSELYKEKSNIEKDLNVLLDNSKINYSFELGYYSKLMIGDRPLPLKSVSLEFREKIKKETIEHLQDRLKQIDKQLKQL